MLFTKTTFIKKLMLSSALVLGLSGAANAHNFNNSSCSVNINGEIVIDETTASITLEHSDTIVLSQTGEAWVNDEAIQLSAEQARYVSDYVEGLQKVVPKAISLAAKAIELTNDTLVEVFSSFLGEGNSFSALIDEKLSYLQEKLEAHVNQKPNSVTFNSAFFGGPNTEESEFDQEIDTVVDEVMGRAAGEFLMALGQSLFSGDGSMSNFEQKMESVGDRIENAISEKSELLEEEALDVCDTLKQVDIQEAKLQTIPELKELNFIHVAKSSA